MRVSRIKMIFLALLVCVFMSANVCPAMATVTIVINEGTSVDETETVDETADDEEESQDETELATESTSEAAVSEDKTQVEISDDYEIPTGIRVAGIDLGGMTVLEARACLAAYVASVGDGTLTLTIDGEEEVIAYADFDVQVSEEDVIEEICQIGTKGNLIQRYKELADVENNQVEYSLPISYDEDKLIAIVEEKSAAHNQEAKSAEMTRVSGEFVITESQSGIEVDVEATVEAVAAAFGEDWDGSSLTVEMVAEVTEAEYTKEDLEAATDLLGSYSTNFSSSTSNRKANVKRAAELINGTILYPGETFSYASLISPVTTANGYYTATGYSGNKVVETVGGGVCQVSSTLYNAVLRAELEVVERTNHGLTVSYVPLAADATYSSSGLDFKFKNNLDSPIYVEAYTVDSTLYIKIYGEETRASNRTIEIVSVTEQTITPGDDVITEDSTKEEGYKEVTQAAHTGYVASLYKKVYIDGVLSETILINTSTYRATPRYITVGTKVAETTTGTSSETQETTGSGEEESTGDDSSGSASSSSTSSGGDSGDGSGDDSGDASGNDE